MPAVRNLSTPGSGSPSADAPVAPPAVTPAVVAAAASTGATLALPGQAELALPSWISKPLAVPAEIPGSSGGPFVGQLNIKTGKREKLLAAGVKDGEYYLDDGASIYPLRPLKFFLLAAEFFRTDMATNGDIIAATRDVSDKSLVEHVVCHAVVVNGETCIPAKIDFRRTQWDAGRAAIEAARLAADPDFPSKGDAYKVAAQFPYPFGRMVTEVFVGERVSKMGKNAGSKYWLSEGSARPATVKEMEALFKALGNDDFRKQLDKTREGYETRVNAIQKLVK